MLKMQRNIRITHQISMRSLVAYTKAFNLDMLKIISWEREVRAIKTILVTASLLGVCALNASPLVVNSDAVGKSSLYFLEQMDEQFWTGQ